MVIRKPLQDQLIAAWRRAIQTDYSDQRINSERSLQAALWSQLNQVLPRNTRRLFVEPRVELNIRQQTHHFYPDLVICNTQTVIAVIELKYQPRVRPSYRKDLRTLAMLARYRHQVQVSNVRYRGTTNDARAYPLSQSVLFVWAGVHRPLADKSDAGTVHSIAAGIKPLTDCFLEMHAETVPRGGPRIYVQTY